MEVLPGQTIAVWFSCGAASAVAAKKTVEIYGHSHTVRILNNPVMEEHEDNRRFLADCEAWIGQSIEIVTNEKWPNASAEQVWKKRRYMAGVNGAPCTTALKKEARQEWERQNKADWHVLGFTVDEQIRHRRFTLTERSNVLPILIESSMTKADCAEYIHKAGIELPAIYRLGYPNANCIGCVKVTSPTYWNHVRRMHPEVFIRRAALSREIGCRLVEVKGERVFLDELSPDARGRDMKTIDFDCGIFCEEKEPKP